MEKSPEFMCVLLAAGGVVSVNREIFSYILCG